MNSPDPTGTATLAKRYRALLGLGRTFLGSPNSRDLYQTIYVETAKVVELSGFLLSLYDDQSDVATVVFSADEGKESKSGLTYRGADSEVLRTGTPTAIEDQTDTRAVLFPGDGGPGGVRSTLAVPLLWRNRVIGALAIYASHADAYEAADYELLGRVADLAAVMENRPGEHASFVEELQRRSHAAEKLEEIVDELLLSSPTPTSTSKRHSLSWRAGLHLEQSPRLGAAMDLLDLDGAGSGSWDVKGHRLGVSRGTADGLPMAYTDG